MNGYVGVVAAQHAVGADLNTYTTAKSVINPQALWPIAGNQLSIGKRLRVSADFSLYNAAQITYTFQVMMGSPNIVAFATGAISVSTTVHATPGAGHHIEINLRLDSEGSGTAAKFFGQAIITGPYITTGAVADGTFPTGVPISSPTVAALGTGFDSTIANILDFWVGISASAAGNGIKVWNYMVEDMGNMPL